MLLSALIEHPDVGLILYDAGCAEDLDVVCDSFPLDIQIATDDIIRHGRLL